MNLQSLSMDSSMQRVQDQAATKVLGLAMNVAKEQSTSLAKLMDGATFETIIDPALGSNINLLA
jgi:hypothetical protein